MDDGRCWLTDVVAGRRHPVGTLDQETEERLPSRWGRTRSAASGHTPRAGSLDLEGDLDRCRQAAEVLDLAGPDQPLLAPPSAAQRHAPPRILPGDRPLDDRLGHPGAAGPQPLDASQEQQGAGLDRAQRRGDLPDGGRGGHRVVVEGEDEERPARKQRLRRERPDVVLDPEVLAAAVNARALRVGVYRLEADAELPDRGEVPALPALADPADAADVGLGEGPPVVPQLQAVLEELEGQLGRARVLGVLDQLEDEVGALAVKLPEQVEHGGVPAVPGDVLLADLGVVSRHRRPPPPPGRRQPPARADHPENEITWS